MWCIFSMLSTVTYSSYLAYRNRWWWCGKIQDVAGEMKMNMKIIKPELIWESQALREYSESWQRIYSYLQNWIKAAIKDGKARVCMQLGFAPSPLRHSEYEPSLASDTWNPQKFSPWRTYQLESQALKSRLWGLKQAISASPKANINQRQVQQGLTIQIRTTIKKKHTTPASTHRLPLHPVTSILQPAIGP